MSTLLVAAILVGTIAAICLLLVQIHNKHQRDARNQLLKHFSRSGTENNLSFSSQEILPDSILGLDGVNRKLLLLTRANGLFRSFIIDLAEVNHCTVKKIYGQAGDIKSRKPDQYLQKIVLHFEMDRQPPVEIVFYQHLDNHVYETPELEQKALHWKTILSKMQAPLKDRA